VRGTTINAIYQGLGITTPTSFHHLRLERPAADCQKLLREFIRDHHISVPIIDSYVPAAGAEPESADAMARLFRAIRGFGPEVTTVVLTHMSKPDLDKLVHARPFGSVMVSNFARSLWQAARGDPDSEERLTLPDKSHRWTFILGLYQQKKSIGWKHHFATKITLTGPDLKLKPASVIEFARADVTQDPVLTRRLTIKAQIATLLGKRGPTDTKTIAEHLQIKPTTARARLNEMAAEGRITRNDVGGKGTGDLTTWTLITHPRHDP
jgi:hypothetical protein